MRKREICWFAQVYLESGSYAVCIGRASACRAKACHPHGGVMHSADATGRQAGIPREDMRLRDESRLTA